ncbi:MAG TPA: hypothetical protein VFA97_01895 [Gaiellaceae bacterium]|nr:hypothetical protein [Gaiellaceae bacterium]
MVERLPSVEIAILERLISVGGDERLSALVELPGVEDVRAALASLVRQGLVEIDQVELLAEGETTGRPVSALTPEVPSTSNQRVTTLTQEQAAVVLAYPGNWLVSIARTWFEATVNAAGEAAYIRNANPA